MNDAESPDWTLNDHLSAGHLALEEIDQDHIHNDPQPICHHFIERDPVDPMTVSVEDTYSYLSPRFQALGLDFLADRLEAWEIEKPDRAWLDKRIAGVIEMAEQSGLQYLGWTWEPRDRQPIAASDITVINNRSLTR